ncbi:Hint domain-containing protein [Paracoccus sp. (in: a-proteobacteria)]|uniref:Hint domain-containing protein n=1 Tax=Paracoccus sp. TaxID=267 RepID=UPI0026DF1830|nr:Hint domain-containing protein [Paracoccus sp. (in: a-proteobacteria)]MDO5648710.1 Hint domain-containing protein [Paracoccus sp. (in: a-proteobacteria)]
MRAMLDRSGMSVDNYDATLMGWADQVETRGGPRDITLGAQDLKYSLVGEAARTRLEAMGWRFDGDSLYVDPIDFDPCFANGTLIATPHGPVRIDDLVVGDLVVTLDAGPQRVLWIGERAIPTEAQRANPKRCPIRIPAGAFGPGQPERDLIVSRQHRILINTDLVQQLTGVEDILIAAHKLVGLNGIEQLGPQSDLSYHHILLEQHHILMANGLPAESLLLGAQAIKSMPEADLEELRAIFPDVLHKDFKYASARMTNLTGRTLKLLLEPLRTPSAAA